MVTLGIGMLHPDLGPQDARAAHARYDKPWRTLFVDRRSRMPVVDRWRAK
jgi:hypothetical protein